MAPPNRKRPASRRADQRAGRRGKPKVCVLCAEHAVWVDYKDINLLRRFVSDRGKIRSRSNTGTCAQHQPDVATAIKTARELAMLPYTVRVSASDRPGGRGRGGAPRRDGPQSERPDGPGATPGGTDVGDDGAAQAAKDDRQAEAGTEQAGDGETAMPATGAGVLPRGNQP